MNANAKLYAGLALAAALGLWLITRKGVAASLARGAVTVAEGVAVGTVKGVGDVLGVPDTDQDQCTIDLANGNLGAASFSCPAPRWFNVAVLGKTDLRAEQLKFIRAEGATP